MGAFLVILATLWPGGVDSASSADAASKPLDAEFLRGFLAAASPVTADAIAEHVAHIVRVAGEDTPALGSDWDGMITPPRDLRSCLDLPRLVQHMLERGFTVDAIRKVLGGNFLRALGALRP